MSKKWRIGVPGYREWFMYGKTEKDIRRQIREFMRVARVPRGTLLEKVDEGKNLKGEDEKEMIGDVDYDD